MRAAFETSAFIVSCATIAFAAGDAAAQNARADTTVLEEIIVTAQKRSERLQDVPASITAIEGEQLAAFGASQLSDYTAYVPGLDVTSLGTPGQTQITLRGINTGTLSSATVGTYIDDTPLGSSTNNARAGQLTPDLFPSEIERIEVLRGPQGTLYGANTLGGLLKYVLRAPSLDALQFEAGVDATTVKNGEEGWGARAALDAPLIDQTLGIRVSGFHEDLPGWIDNAATGEEDVNNAQREGARAALLWQAQENVAIKLNALWSEIDANGENVIPALGVELEPLYGEHTQSHLLPVGLDQTFRYYSANVNWTLEWAELISSTSYSQSRTTTNSDLSASLGALFGGILVPSDTGVDLDKITQELRLTSATGRSIEWLVGLFYTDEDAELAQNLEPLASVGVPIPALQPLGSNLIDSTYREYAGFGDLTYRFSDRWDVTVGLRHSRNEQDFSQRSFGLLVFPPDPTQVFVVNGDSSESVTNFMVSPRFRPTPDTMIYARVASGYRPGGPNPIAVGVPPSFDADELINYELGVKSALLDRTLNLEFAAFHIDWDDLQVGLFYPGGSYLANAGAATSQGVEFSVSLQAGESWRFGLSGSYTDATLDEDVPALGGRDGDLTPYVPEWNAAATFHYERPLTGGSIFQFGGGYRYVDTRFSAFSSSPTAIRFDDYQVADLHAALILDAVTARVYANNVFDEFAFINAGVGQTNLGPVDLTITQPRTIGLRLDVRF